MSISHNLGKTHPDSYVIRPSYEPLKDWYTLKLKCNAVDESLRKKVTIILKRKSGKTKALYSTFEKGWASCRTKEFGEYYVDIDTIAPSIELISKRFSHGKLAFKVDDNFDQFEYYEANVDGRWLKLFFERKAKTFYCSTKDLELDKGEHIFSFWIKDAQGNKRIFERSFSI